jgi:short-subunit dehydrogenase
MTRIILLSMGFFVYQNLVGQNLSNGSTSHTSPMPDSIPKRPCALIAGGSKGIGYAIAEAWARRNYDLILIARHWDSLLSAKEKLESAYGIHVDLLSYDLSREESAIDIAVWCAERNVPLKVLCNVAGSGGSRDYPDISIDSIRYMVRLNVESCMTLTYTLLPLLEKNSPSYIINVASMAGFAPIPMKNVYSSTKGAVIYFSYSLHEQLMGTGIHVSCLAPGPVYTKPEIAKETRRQLGWMGDMMQVSPARVGELAVRKTLKGKLMIVPGFLPGVLSVIIRLMPKKMATSIYGRLGKSV